MSTAETNTLGKTTNLLDVIEITILESEKRANPVLNIRDYFTAYLIETKLKDEKEESFEDFPAMSLTWHRYSEFEQLQLCLQTQYPFVVMPPLPEKKHTYTWRNPNHVIQDITDPDFVDRRRASLENFLHRIAAHPVLCEDKLFRLFLTKENSWNDSLKQEGYMQLVETKLRDLTMLPKSVSTDSEFRTISHCSKQLELNIDSILKTRLSMVDELYTIDSLHTHIGRLFSEWSVIEKNMGDGLQKAGHFIDSVANYTEAALQDEDVIADQLKEYLFYANSLDIVQRHRIRLQMQIEHLKNSIKMKTDERNRIQQGKATLMVRLFGALQTKEIRDEKIQLIDQRIAAEEDKVVELEKSLQEFTESALEDFNRFQKQKDVDIQQTLNLYVLEQIKSARRGLSTWTNIRNCIEAIP